MVERFNLTDDYSISRVINGCWQLSVGHSIKSQLDKEDIMKAFTMLVERGFTTFDCADIYTGAEEFLGEFSERLKKITSINDKRIQIHTKYVPDKDKLGNIKFEDTKTIITRSLTRLKKDTLDLVQFHWWDYEVDGMLDTFAHLERLKEEGYIRNLALTNFDTEHIAMIKAANFKIVSCQTQYSLLDRRPEKGFIDYCQAQGISQLCYGTLAGGLISERYIGVDDVDPDNRSQVKYKQIIEEGIGWDNYQNVLVILKTIADKHKVDLPQVAVRYILDRKGVGATIIGTRSSRHVLANEKIFSFKLDDDDISKIELFLAKTKILAGDCYELERSDPKFKSIIKTNLNKEK